MKQEKVLLSIQRILQEQFTIPIVLKKIKKVDEKEYAKLHSMLGVLNKKELTKLFEDYEQNISNKAYSASLKNANFSKIVDLKIDGSNLKVALRYKKYPDYEYSYSINLDESNAELGRAELLAQYNEGYYNETGLYVPVSTKQIYEQFSRGGQAEME